MNRYCPALNWWHIIKKCLLLKIDLRVYVFWTTANESMTWKLRSILAFFSFIQTHTLSQFEIQRIKEGSLLKFFLIMEYKSRFYIVWSFFWIRNSNKLLIKIFNIETVGRRKASEWRKKFQLTSNFEWVLSYFARCGGGKLTEKHV